MTDRRYLPNADPGFIDALYRRFLTDPLSVDPSLWGFFAEHADGSVIPVRGLDELGGSVSSGIDAGFQRLREAYRRYGHLAAPTDPLGLAPLPGHPDLDLGAHGLSADDLAETVDGPDGSESLGSAIERLKETWCGPLSLDLVAVDDPAARDWLISAMESGEGAVSTVAERREILDALLVADGQERFMNVKFPSNKRFGMEGSESQLPLFRALLSEAVRQGIDRIVMAPGHRGRLNVITNVAGKPLVEALSEVMGTPALPQGTELPSDVPYHLGTEQRLVIDGAPLSLRMLSHPSHVELVWPVAQGVARAERDRAERDRAEWDRTGRDRVGEAVVRRLLPLMVHTDGAFSGQGVVYETLQLARLPAYDIGGSVHVVVNNQLAFTTKVEDGRSTHGATDIARAFGIPVLRVNGDAPEAAVRAARLAVRYRQRFGRDIIIDFVCYRRRGHNELDEPTFTQPEMYDRISGTVPVPDAYASRLIDEGIVTAAEADALRDRERARLDAAYEAATGFRRNAAAWPGGAWATLVPPLGPPDDPVTGVDMGRLARIAEAVSQVPEGFSLHPKIARQWAARLETVEKGVGLVWATAEALAFGSLLEHGYRVRLTGEDTARGTFSQRHGVVSDQRTGAAHLTFAPLTLDPAAMLLRDSPLIEEATIAFEYGYATADPDTLVCWEAQFGDFANGAQALIDQFIVAGAHKWQTPSGLVLLLPHGLEGGGPEHSSARPERFLQLAADHAISVASPSTPANYFHLLRRQMLRRSRRPLIMMTPKSMLRHPRAVSPLAAMTEGTAFHPIVVHGPEDAGGPVRRVILCTGKLAHELADARAGAIAGDVAIVSIEELYPFPTDALSDALAAFEGAELVWAQEEHENMGAWRHVSRLLPERVRYLGRPESPSPATGVGAWHRREQAALIEAALGA